jgi:nickel transport protein
MRRALPLLALWAGAAGAHEVHHAVAPGPAVVVTLSYADGKPFAYEKYELTPAGATVPAQVGNSDAQGRVVFLPGTAANWRLKAWTADGHGVDLRFAAPTTAAPVPAVAPAAADAANDAPSRASLLLFGLALLLAGFGLLQLFVRRKGSQ